MKDNVIEYIESIDKQCIISNSIDEACVPLIMYIRY